MLLFESTIEIPKILLTHLQYAGFPSAGKSSCLSVNCAQVSCIPSTVSRIIKKFKANASAKNILPVSGLIMNST